MGKNTKKYAFGVVAIVALIVLFGTDAGNDLLDSTSSSTVISNPTISTTGVQAYDGSLGVTTKTTDTTDPAVVYGGDTEITTICYGDNGSADVDDWTPLDTGSSAEEEAMTIPIIQGAKSAGGTVDMWCEVAVGSAQDYYVDVAKGISQNSRIDRFIYDDPNQDNIDAPVFHVNLEGISPADPNNTPTLTLFWRLIDEGSLDVDSPTGLDNVGQGSVENRIKWSMDMDNAGDGEYLQYVKLTLNQTDDGMWFENLSQIDVPNFGVVKFSEMDRTDLESTTEYKIQFGIDASEGILLLTPKNGDTENDSHVILQTNFDAENEGICMQLEIRTVDAQGAFTTNSDDIDITENANDDDCST